MEEYVILYEKNSVPLEQAKDLVVGELYFNDAGHGYKYLGKDEFEFSRKSPLISIEKLSGIDNDHTLKLFWILSKNLNK